MPANVFEIDFQHAASDVAVFDDIGRRQGDPFAFPDKVHRIANRLVIGIFVGYRVAGYDRQRGEFFCFANGVLFAGGH